MNHVGLLRRVTNTELVLNTCSWVADSGQFGKALDTGDYSETEFMGDGVIVSRENLIDATPIDSPLPTHTK